MNQTIKIASAFVVGALAGAAVSAVYLRDYFESRTEDEVRKAREYYAKKYNQDDNKSPNEDISQHHEPVHHKYKKILENMGYLKDDDSVSEEPEVEDIGPKPYVIEPEAYGELDGYMMCTLTYFSDGILVDEDDSIVDDVEATIGDALNYFGEYEADTVWVRNDRRRCDYEVLKSNGRFEDLADRMPVPVEV